MDKNKYFSEILNKNNIEHSIIKKNDDLYKIYQNKPLVIISSSVSDISEFIEKNNYNKLIIICDTEVEIKDIKCDSNNISEKNKNNTITTNKESMVLPTNFNNKSIIFVAENVLLSDLNKEKVSLITDKINSSNSDNYNVSINQNYLDFSKTILTNNLLENFLLIFIATITIVIFNYLMKNKSKISLDIDLLDIIKEIGKTTYFILEKNLNILINIIFISVILYISLFATYIIYKKFVLNDLVNAVYKILDFSIFQPYNLFDIKYFLIFTSTLFIAICTLLIIVFYILKTLRNNNEKTSENLIKTFNLLLVLSMLILLLVNYFVDVDKIFFLNIFLCTVFLISLRSKSFFIGINNDKQFKKYLIVGLFCINLIGLVKIFYFSNNNLKYSDLFSKKSVDLPYFKTNESNIRYNNSYFLKNNSIFINEILVFSPLYESIVNLNLIEYKKNLQENHLVVSLNKEQLIMSYLKNDKLFDSFPDSNTYKYFYINNQTQPFSLNAKLKCLNVTKPFPIRFRYYKEENSKLVSDEFTFLNFVGCEKASKIYKIEFNKKEFEGPLVFEILDYPSNLEKIEILSNNSSSEVKKIDIRNGVIFENIVNNKNEITVYSLDNNRKLIFKNNLKESLNLPKIINNLLEDRSIDSNFIIWTDNKNDSKLSEE
jgi:hypothetical protein